MAMHVIIANPSSFLFQYKNKHDSSHIIIAPENFALHTHFGQLLLKHKVSIKISVLVIATFASRCSTFVLFKLHFKVQVLYLS